MTDFAKQVQAFTCISDDKKQKIIADSANLDDKKREKILEILADGEAKKNAIQGEHDKKMLAHIENYLQKVTDFKRGPLRKAFKNAENFDHKADEDSAEDLLKDL